MCISTVHYCCHRNVMHSVSYRLTQLNGTPCPICSGSLIFILFWKGIVNTVGRRDERRGGGGEDEREGETKEAGSSSLLSSSPLSPSLLCVSPLFSLMSVLSIGSQCESVALIYTVTLYYTHVGISSLILCVCITDWFGRRPPVLSQALKLLVFTMWWLRKVVFEMIWQIFGGPGVVLKHRIRLYTIYLPSRWFISSASTYILVYLTCITFGIIFFMLPCRASPSQCIRGNLHKRIKWPSNLSDSTSSSSFHRVLHFNFD